jgi:hypothetical protein
MPVKAKQKQSISIQISLGKAHHITQRSNLRPILISQLPPNLNIEKIQSLSKNHATAPPIPAPRVETGSRLMESTLSITNTPRQQGIL